MGIIAKIREDVLVKCALAFVHIGVSAFGAPPPNPTGQFHDWFQSLRVPGSGIMCCSAADCRLVDARWNDRTQHFEAKVMREEFSNALQYSPLVSRNPDRLEKDKREWLGRWIANYGNVTEILIEIPETKIIRTDNPTGRAVLCWSPDYEKFDGVFCFVPYLGAFNESADRIRIHG